MEISIALVSTVLLGMLALSAPPVLCIVLFRVMVKEGAPLDSQKFRHDFLIGFLFWLGVFFLNLFLIFFVGKAAMADRLQEASVSFVLSLICALGTFSFTLLLRKKLYRESPDFIINFFLLVVALCFSLLLVRHLDLGMKRAQKFMDEGHQTSYLSSSNRPTAVPSGSHEIIHKMDGNRQLSS